MQLPLEGNGTVGSRNDTHSCLMPPHTKRGPGQQLSVKAMQVNSSIWLKELLSIKLMFLEFMFITQLKFLDNILEKKTEKW